MTEKEITKALRWFAKVTTHCEHNIVSCPECEFHGFCTDPYSDDGICKMHECLTAAADLIESQAAENAAYRAENERLAADLKDMRDQNQTISVKNRELCIKLDEREKNSKATQKAMLDKIAKLRNDLTAKTALLDAAIAEQETLQRAFAESQRRELAAVEDLIKIAEYSGSLTCHCNEMIKIAKAWRCPEAGKGE